MRSTKRLLGVLAFSAATAFTFSAYAQSSFSSLDRALSLVQSSGQRERDEDHKRRSAIVGMWIATYYVGAFQGPETERFDLAIQQFSSDGNELMNSALVPPEAGNVCFGVWKDLGHNTFKLRHTGWDFGDPATTAVSATFSLNVSLTVSPDGKTYSGTYTSDLKDLEGKVLPETAVEGDVRATRFEVDEANGVDARVMGRKLFGSHSRRKSC